MLALLCVAFSGCGSCADEKQPAAEKQLEPSALVEEMRAAGEWPPMLTVDDADSRAQKGFSTISTLDYGKVDAYTLIYAADGSSFELAVIRLKDSADMPALEQSLKKHIEKRAESYRYYKPDQVARAEGAAVVSHGRYAALIMCSDNASVRAVFDKYF